VFAAGHKRDTWFAIDSLTGAKVQTLSVNSAPEVCLSSGVNQVFIGRTGLSATRVFCCVEFVTVRKIVSDNHRSFILR